VDWLPSKGWNQTGSDPDTAGRMGAFIAQTMELHRMYLDRLQGVKDEGPAELEAISGVLATPILPFEEAAGPVMKLLRGLDAHVHRSLEFGRKQAAESGTLTADEAAALFLYTTESPFYRRLNAALRDPNRAVIRPYFGYLRLFFAALGRLEGKSGKLYRGVGLDLRPQYPQGGTVTWWGVSSCTPKLSVAEGFLGGSGKRTLFEVTPAGAVSIRRFSAFTGEDEYVLPPGTRLKGTTVATRAGGMNVVSLTQVPGERLVS
jgi:hypothetical protein